MTKLRTSVALAALMITAPAIAGQRESTLSDAPAIDLKSRKDDFDRAQFEACKEAWAGAARIAGSAEAADIKGVWPLGARVSRSESPADH